ncbi:MAG: hypothetical protein V1922_03715 [bacterium]
MKKNEKNASEDEPPNTKKNIETVYISNILEGYYKSYDSLKSKEECDFWKKYDTLDSNRALLYGKDNKIIITSSPIHRPHFKHIKTLMGWKNVFNICPNKPSHSISEDCRINKSLRNEIIRVIKNNPGVSLIPYRYTPQFQKLIHFLQTKELHFKTPETIPENKQFILNYFNTKRGFRHLWHISQADNPPYVQIPEGFITQNKKELIDAAWWFKQHGESFVIKYNSGVQGIGIILVDHMMLPDDKKRFDAYMRNLLKDNMWNEPIIIIEKMIPANEKAESISPSLEIYINPKGEVSGSYACDQIMANDKCTYRGIYVYPELMTDLAIKKTFDAGVTFGKKLAEYGYRGVFDIDLIRSKHNEIYAVEANLRRNGGTHLHELCLALLGEQYGSSYHTLIEDIILKKNHTITYQKCLSLFADHLYSHEKHSGIIFANPDMLNVHILVVVLIAKTRKHIQELRKIIDTTLKGTIKD